MGLNHITDAAILLAAEAIRSRRWFEMTMEGDSNSCRVTIYCGLNHSNEVPTYMVKLGGDDLSKFDARSLVIDAIETAMNVAQVKHEPRYVEELETALWKLTTTYDAHEEWILGQKITALGINAPDPIKYQNK